MNAQELLAQYVAPVALGAVVGGGGSMVYNAFNQPTEVPVTYQRDPKGRLIVNEQGNPIVAQEEYEIDNRTNPLINAGLGAAAFAAPTVIRHGIAAFRPEPVMRTVPI
jgi:hypothetical protein